ncbi:MAG: cysteate synthase [Bacteroidetes bacterium CG2_30_33_31]|nr:MAG: cysteate synthase [Bacteroidetes bacterium CG2_30_33_31]
MEDFKPTKYLLSSIATGKTFEDEGWTLDDPNYDKPALIRSIYSKHQIEIKNDSHGMYKFADWLPILRTLKGSSAPVTYKSKALAKHLGLSNLYITFSGWWPEKGGFNRTCSFKETEAYTVMARIGKDEKRIMVVASAGNTARAFAQVCSDNNIPLLLTLPADNLSAMWFDKPLNNCVKLIVSETGCDYYDAINLSNMACTMKEFIAEGGAKNVARREGMGTTTLSAAIIMGRIPDYYFQAVGSGTGAIAAYEANLRLIKDGRFGSNMMKLMVSQNKPFTPIYDAWHNDSRELPALDADLARQQVQEILAKVLSNRKPPYSIIGGLFDAMKHSNGDVLLASNEEAIEAMKLFETLEGIDIHPAAGIATASLINAVKENKVEKDAAIMLNITGCGEERLKTQLAEKIYYLKPSHVFEANPAFEEVESVLSNLFAF